MSIKDCPQPDAPELVMRADGYHYQEDEMSYRELTDKQVMAAAMDYQEANMSCYRAVIAADRALNAPADRTYEQEPIPVSGGRESVEDALMIVESFGPGIDGLNDTYARQIILADEVKRLRGLYEQAVQGRRDFREALREQQGEQEPVGYIDRKDLARLSNYKAVIWPGTNEINAVPLYTHPAPDVLATLRAEVVAYADGRTMIPVGGLLALIDKARGDGK